MINIIVSSTQYPGYGGAATNAYKIIKYLRSNGNNVVGVFFFGRKVKNYDPDNIGGIFLYNDPSVDKIDILNYDEIKNDIEKYLKAKPDICLAKNYIAPIYCKKIFDCYTIYLVSGINHMSTFYTNNCAIDILKDDFEVKEIIPEEILCNKISDLIILNSNLSLTLFQKIYPNYKNKIYSKIVDTSELLCQKINKNAKKVYDIIICCSNLKRNVKNNLFLIPILQNKIFDKYKKCIIGKNSNLFKNIKNVELYDIMPQTECVEMFSKSKILLIPSLFDANPNTVKEAYSVNCLPLITENIGYSELFPDFLVCKSYLQEEWVLKINNILNNYNNLNQVIINYQKCDFENILESIFNNI
jgi:glycosyltransferase involved in cell wall biosynthesis